MSGSDGCDRNVSQNVYGYQEEMYAEKGMKVWTTFEKKCKLGTTVCPCAIAHFGLDGSAVYWSRKALPKVA